MRITLSIVAVFGLLVWTPGSALAKQKAAKTEAEPPPAATPLNACGCYRDAQDQCHCNKGKKLKCECENDCEPAGCEQQRQKQQGKRRRGCAEEDSSRTTRRARGGQGSPGQEGQGEGCRRSQEEGRRRRRPVEVVAIVAAIYVGEIRAAADAG